MCPALTCTTHSTCARAPRLGARAADGHFLLLQRRKGTAKQFLDPAFRGEGIECSHDGLSCYLVLACFLGLQIVIPWELAVMLFSLKHGDRQAVGDRQCLFNILLAVSL